MTKPKWLTVNHLLNSLLDTTKFDDGETFSSRLDTLEEHIRKENHLYTASLMVGESDQELLRKQHQEIIKAMEEEKNEILDEGRRLLKNLIESERLITGYGFSNPRSKEREMIPPSAWAFFNIDYEKNAAYDNQNNIVYAGLVFSAITDNTDSFESMENPEGFKGNEISIEPAQSENVKPVASLTTHEERRIALARFLQHLIEHGNLIPSSLPFTVRDMISAFNKQHPDELRITVDDHSGYIYRMRHLLEEQVGGNVVFSTNSQGRGAQQIKAILEKYPNKS